MELANEPRKQQWQERAKHYPYNVLTGVFGDEFNDPPKEQFDYKTFEEKLAKDIQQRISTLPPALQYIFMLHVESKLSYDQIASREDLPMEVVLDRIALTWRQLRHPQHAKQLRKHLDLLNNPNTNVKEKINYEYNHKANVRMECQL